MVLGRHGRGFTRTIFGPVARLLVRWKVSPDVVTVLGTLSTIAASFLLIARGHLIAGPVVLLVVLLADSIDGLMAREMGRNSRWGAFLDSTMDRFADASLFASFALLGLSIPTWHGPWIFGLSFALVPLALIVSYARARAEAVGISASVGIAERADRLIATLVPAFLVGLGAPLWVLIVGLGYAVIASAITILQRMRAVWREQ